MAGVVTKTAKIKMLKARKGEAALPPVSGIAVGDGAESGGTVRDPLETDTDLQNELVRKEYITCEKVTETCYRYRMELGADELAGKTLNEAALYDSDGDLLCIRSFLGKPKDSSMEMAFEFDDIF